MLRILDDWVQRRSAYVATAGSSVSWDADQDLDVLVLAGVLGPGVPGAKVECLASRSVDISIGNEFHAHIGGVDSTWKEFMRQSTTL